MSLIITITITQAAAAADPMSITYNGYQYKTLASHNPHSAQVINEYGQTLYDLINEELKILKTLSHPNIVWLHEIIDDPSDGNIYIVTEFYS
jgi:serine/threonine protein kinase